MADYGIRKWLKDNGLAQNDNEISYDNNTVYLKGRKFMDATPRADGSTYAGASDLSNAYKNYQSTGMQNEVSDALTKYKTMMAQPRKEFSYDPNTDPQYQNAMQQALRGAQTAQNNTLANLRARGQGKSSYSETVANQIQQKAVGDVNAQQLPQMIAQAYQRYMGEQDLAQRDLANTGNYLQYANNLYQQGVDNNYRDNNFREQQKQTNIGNAMQLSQLTGQLYQPKEGGAELFGQTPLGSTLAGRQANLNAATQLGQQTGRVLRPTTDWGAPLYDQVDTAPLNYPAIQDVAQNDRADRQLNASLANMSSDNARAAAADARAAGNQRLASLFEVWDRTGRAPEGIPGVEAGTPIVGKQQNPGSNDFESEYVANLDRIDPAKRKSVFTQEKSNIIRDIGVTGYNRLYGMYFDEYGNPKQ